MQPCAACEQITMPEFVKSGEAPDEEPRDVFEDDEERVTLYDQLEAFKGMLQPLLLAEHY